MNNLRIVVDLAKEEAMYDSLDAMAGDHDPCPTRPVTRDSFATHLLGYGYSIRAVQELLGYEDVPRPMSYATRAQPWSERRSQPSRTVLSRTPVPGRVSEAAVRTRFTAERGQICALRSGEFHWRIAPPVLQC